jgi:signal peptidase
MEPAFYRGDLLFLTNPVNEPYQLGDITVYKVREVTSQISYGAYDYGVDPWRGYSNRASCNRKSLHVSNRTDPAQSMPIDHVYRIDTPLEQEILTKGDNNEYDDISLYRRMKWLERRHIVGKVRGFLPYVGYVTIAMVQPASYSRTPKSDPSSERLSSDKIRPTRHHGPIRAHPTRIA